MKVDNPQFNPHTGFVECHHCPLGGKNQRDISLCFDFGEDCPTSATYQKAVEFAERGSK